MSAPPESEPKHYVLDTSVLIEPHRLTGGAAAVSVVSLAELQFGVLVAKNTTERAARLARVGAITAAFPNPLPVSASVAREWGALQALVRERGGNPRARQADLIIAATARIHGATVLTRNPADFKLVADRVAIAAPADLGDL